MNLSLILAFLWVVASAVTAMLPMRRQYIPGVTLLVFGVPMLVFVGYQNGWWITAIALAAAVSMFRHPLRYIFRRTLGLPVALPKDMQKDKE
jgi:hypothetical protein